MIMRAGDASIVMLQGHPASFVPCRFPSARTVLVKFKPNSNEKPADVEVSGVASETVVVVQNSDTQGFAGASAPPVTTSTNSGLTDQGEALLARLRDEARANVAIQKQLLDLQASKVGMHGAWGMGHGRMRGAWGMHAKAFTHFFFTHHTHACLVYAGGEQSGG